jgi:hypothetical protein
MMGKFVCESSHVCGEELGVRADPSGKTIRRPVTVPTICYAERLNAILNMSLGLPVNKYGQITSSTII